MTTPTESPVEATDVAAGASEPAAAPEGHRLWRGLKEALAGNEQDFTRGSLNRAIALLAIPMVLEMGMESLFAVVDAFFVAKLGPDAIATVGLTEAVLTLVFAVAIGLSMGATALVARRIGEGDREAAAVTAVQVYALGLAVSLAVAVGGYFAAPDILRLMGASPEVIAGGTAYTRILLAGSPTVLLLFLGNAVFRGAGDAAIAMRVLWFANLINIVLDPCLIFGWGPFPELGLAGAAVATTIGRGLGCVYQIVVLVRQTGRIVLRRRHLRLDGSILVRLVRVSTGGVLQYLVATASWVFLVRVIALFGSVALAGYTLAVRVVIFTILPSWGLTNAAATLVGQNLGAGQPERAERSVWLTARVNFVFMAAVALLFLILPETLIGLFTQQVEVIEVGASCLRWVASCYVVFAYGLVMIQAFNGAGDTTTPTILNLLCYWIWQLPVAWVLAVPAGLGPSGVFIAIASSEILLGLAGIVLFRRGKWKERVV
ncbi:MAG TPA: MATE family efflux transporter [Thermoanaerobaculia bacterium]|nr:MATE family efflux transporter [Thermoanaerobaculia bacterium]